MKISKKTINHTDYLYAIDNIYVARGKTILKNKSLGRADAIKNIAQKKKEFYEFIIKEETRLRTSFWLSKISNKKFSKYIDISDLEHLRSKLYRSKQGAGEFASFALETAFLADFIYNSNKMEGSKVPRERVEEIIRENKMGNDEVNNTIKALGFINTKFTFTLKNIEKAHKILLAHEPSKTKFRKEKVVVNNMDVAHWESIIPQLKELLDWYKKKQHNMYPLELAFVFYFKFERIHPFIDGNGRIGRLIMNKILKDHRYHPMIIWNKRRQAHMNVFKKATEGKEEDYFKFMGEQFERTHKIYLDKIERAYTLDTLMNDFMRPSTYNFD